MLYNLMIYFWDVFLFLQQHGSKQNFRRYCIVFLTDHTKQKQEIASAFYCFLFFHSAPESWMSKNNWNDSSILTCYTLVPTRFSYKKHLIRWQNFHLWKWWQRRTLLLNGPFEKLACKEGLRCNVALDFGQIGFEKKSR